MKQELEQAVAAAVKKLFGQDVAVELTRPDEQFGDYATNAALQLAKPIGKNPREIAESLAQYLQANLQDKISKVEVAGPGFLNLTLTNQTLTAGLENEPARPLAGQTVVAEYSDPNPFKVLHAGHLYTSVVGDAIANLLEHAGAQVHRVNFGGDVGLHVGKTLWAVTRELDGESPEKLAAIDVNERSQWLADCYIKGTQAYEDDESAKPEIIQLNKRVYQIHAEDDHESPLAQIYWTTRSWSYDYFNEFYARIGSQFEKYYPESSVAQLGLNTVQDHIEKGVFEKSDGAVIFNGEPYGLHTRVFINSEGLPTYEAKDVGLIMQKKADYNFDRSVVITGNEQAEYMAVVLKAIEQFEPELAKATTHLTHGLVKLAGGVKMSSRKGNILRAVDVIEAAKAANKKLNEQASDETTLGAIKYAFLKNRMGGDIIYDPKESVSLEGNSGPYLQYALVRAKHILDKSQQQPGNIGTVELNTGERSLVRKLTQWPEVLQRATAELAPHLICTYLYELAQEFNRFYENNRVIGSDQEINRISLVNFYFGVLENGLKLLGIPRPEKM